MPGIESEIEQGTRDRLAPNRDMTFNEVPASWANDQHCRVLTDYIFFAGRGIAEMKLSQPSVAQVDLALDQLVPSGCGRILEIGHEDLGAAIQGVDDHLRVGRPGNFDAAIVEIGGDRSDFPVRFADVTRFRQEVGKLTTVETLLPVDPVG
jgi:hypothetical protein